MFDRLYDKHPFIRKMYEARKKDKLPTLLNPYDDNDIDSMTHTIKTDLLRQLFLEPKYDKIVNPLTGIEIIINKTQIEKAILSLNEKKIDTNDFIKHLAKYKEALFGAYEKYGRKGERKWPMRLQDINDMSRDYTQRPIIYADKEYWVFQMFQYKIYEYLETYIITNNTTDYKTYFDNVWNAELDKLIDIITKQYYTQINFSYYKNIFVNSPIYIDFQKHIYITLNDKLRDERKVKYEENDDKLLEEYVKIKSSKQPDQKQEDKSHIYRQYKDNGTLSDDELTEINLTREEFDKQRSLMHYVHPYYDVCQEQTEEKYENLLCSFENPKMLLELRQLQIKINYLFYIIASQLYDAYIWQTTYTGTEDRQEYLFKKLKQNDLYADENIDLYEKVYTKIILYFDATNVETIINDKVITFIDNYKNSLLKQIKEKYLVDKHNINLFIVLKTHRLYLLYEKNIRTKITDLYDNLGYLTKNKKVAFDTINDPKKIKLFLLNIYNIYVHMDLDFIENKEFKKQFIEMDIFITKLCDEYRNTKNTRIFDNIFPIYTTIERQQFIYHIIEPLTEILNYDDQTDIHKVVFGIHTHPDYINTKNYNMGCKKFDDMKKILKQQIYTVYGITRDITKFNTCISSFRANAAFWYMDISFSYFYDLTLGSHMTDHIRVYIDLYRDNKELLYSQNDTNPRFPLHYMDDKKRIINIITTLKDTSIYIGLFKIPTRQSFILSFLFWNKETLSFELTDCFGFPLFLSTILYETHATYYEIKHMFKDYNSFFYKLPNSNTYLVTKNERDDIKKTQFCTKQNDDKKLIYGRYTNIEVCENTTQVGGNNISIIYKEPFYISQISSYSVFPYAQKINLYYDIFILTISKYYNLINILDPYRILYPNNMILRNYANLYPNMILGTQDNILYYKVTSKITLFLWMIQDVYKLLNKNTQNIYEINSINSAYDAFTFIYDKMGPTTKYNYNMICPEYLNKNKTFTRTILNKINIESVYCNTKQQFYNALKSINTIDFLFINIRPFWFSNAPSGLMRYVNIIYFLWIICIVCDKLTDGSSICISIGYTFHKLSVKIYTFIAYMFEEFHIYTPEINLEYDNDIYLILKNKKKNMNTYYIILNNIYNELEKNIPDLYTSDKYLNLDTSDKYLNLDINTHLYSNIFEQLTSILQDKIIDDIKFSDKQYKKIYKKMKNITKQSNKIFYYNLKKLKYHMKELNKKITKNPEIDYKTEYYKKNLYACIQWSKKYDFPLIEPVMNMTQVLKQDILQDMLSYEQPILFKFKKNDHIKEISSDMLENFYSKALTKYVSETRALDTRDMNVYHQVKVRIDYYHHKLIKEIKKKYNIKGFISQAWIKLLEIYSVIDIIPKNAKTFKSFHFCELPGAFIYATKFFIETKTNIKDWQWKAQSLNPGSLSETDERKAFGDDAGILKRYGKHYDFGNGTGDINDPENLEHYKTNCGDNDFVTADCGLPLSQKNISNILSLSTFLSVLSVLKNGGSCIIKRHVPIDCAQEIFLLNLFYNSFEQTIAYKPRVNQQSQEYYIIGIGYNKLNNILETLETLQKNYVEITQIYDIQEQFLLQLDKMQHIILDNFNKHIKNKIYFADNFTKLTDDDWKMINKTSKEKINEWLELIK